MLVTVSIDIKYLFVEISITQRFTKLLKVDIGYMLPDQFNQSRPPIKHNVPYYNNLSCDIFNSRFSQMRKKRHDIRIIFTECVRFSSLDYLKLDYSNQYRIIINNYIIG